MSRDDKALGLSSFLARDSTRSAGSTPQLSPIFDARKGSGQCHRPDRRRVHDAANHSKFATSEVVTAIGERLAEGQTLTEANTGSESLGSFTHGMFDVAAGAATAPSRIVDPTLTEKSVETAADR